MEITEHELADPLEGLLVAPAHGSDVGVLVLAGSSGRIERERARILAQQGVTALAIRWFGGPGQPQEFAKSPWRPSLPPLTSFNVGERDASEFLAFPRERKPLCSRRCTTHAWMWSSPCRPLRGSGATSVQAGTEHITRIARPGRGRRGH